MEKQINSNSFFRFEDLRVYHKSLDYVNWLLNQNCQLNGLDADLVLKPLVNSASKVSLNIAEGSSRHRTQLIQFLKDAKAAIRECVVYTAIAYKKEYSHKDKTMLRLKFDGNDKNAWCYDCVFAKVSCK